MKVTNPKIIHDGLRSLQVSVVHKRPIQLIANATDSANHFSVNLSLFICMFAACSGSPPQCSTFSSTSLGMRLVLLFTYCIMRSNREVAVYLRILDCTITRGVYMEDRGKRSCTAAEGASGHHKVEAKRPRVEKLAAEMNSCYLSNVKFQEKLSTCWL